MLYVELTDKNGVRQRCELRDPAWKSWDDVDAWARKADDRVTLSGVIKPVTAQTRHTNAANDVRHAALAHTTATWVIRGGLNA